MKALTHDVLYETYRTEKLSRTVHSDTQYVVLASTSELHSRRRCLRDSSILPEELATQSVRLKEEQLRREEEKLREIEVKVQREINEKRQELLARESQLREIEARMARETPGTPAADANGEGEAAS